jgi:hypothetical protein
VWYFLNFSHFIVFLCPIVVQFHVKFCLINSVLIYESEDFEFELQVVQLQALPELQAVDDQFESDDPGAQAGDKERNKRYVDISLQDNANKNTIYKTKFDMKLFYDWAQENDEMRKVEEIPHPELDLSR